MPFWLPSLITTPVAQRCFGVGEELRTAGRLAEAEARFKRAIEWAEPSAERSVAARSVAGRSYLSLGRVALGRGAARRARTALERACALLPREWEPAYYCGCALGLTGDFTGAVEALSRALNLAPTEPRIRVQRGYAHTKAGNVDEAIADLSASGSDLDGCGRFVLATLLVKRSKWIEAERLLDGASDAPQQGSRLLLLGYVREKMGKRADASNTYQQALQHKEAMPFACGRLGVLEAKSGTPAAADRLLTRARAAGVDDDTVLFYQGWVLHKLGRNEGCLEAWTRLLKRKPRRQRLKLLLLRARQAYALELIARGRFVEAVPLWEAYCAERRLDDEAQRIFAELQFRAAGERLATKPPHYDEARRHLERGQETAPADGRFPFYLALLASLRGDYTASVALMECAAASAAPHPAAPAALDRILTAGHLQRKDYAEAAILLEARAGTTAFRDGLLAECLYRANRLGDLAALTSPAPEVSFWKAAGTAASGRLDEAGDALEGLTSFPPARASLGSVLRATALDRARSGDWLGAAVVHRRSREMLGSQASKSPVLDAALLLLGAERGLAVADLELALARDPLAGDVTHALFVASYFGALATSDNSSRDDGSWTMWERAMAAWVLLLRNYGFWNEFQMTFQKRCGADGQTVPQANFRARIQDHVALRLERGFEQSRDGTRLLRLLHREAQAAEHLHALGGLPLPGRAGRTISCGPLGVRLLGLERALGEHVARLHERPHTTANLDVAALLRRLLRGGDVEGPSEAPDRAKVVRLARYFSTLGAAQAMLELERPDEALTALDEVSCPHRDPRRGQARVLGPAQWLPDVCEAGCPDFDLRNPGYNALPQKDVTFRSGAIDLAVDVHLALGQRAVRAAAIDLDAASSAWTTAIRLAGTAETAQATERRIAETVLGRVQPLEEKARYDSAIALLEAAEAVCQGEASQQISGRLAEILTDRGVAAGNERRWLAAVTDLRSAVRRNPHTSRPLLNLAVGLQAWAAELIREGNHDNAESLLAECYQQLHESRARFAGKTDMEQQYRRVSRSFQALLNGRAVQLATDSLFQPALEVVGRALKNFPNDATLLTNERNILLAHATDLIKNQQFKEAQVVLDRAERRCHGDAAALQEVSKLRLLILVMAAARR